ncbi:MAG TPA: CinA family protein [Candidatus Hydrogenedentes bacterium]|jgi:PncC family amidohydrolase|nr:MAG: Nicotinamide-nucleotide amidohydrolase PncC [Candidatus Hydrogenedentes bacterium ADurb.Bin170]HNZ49145.1 CinA family protein [Candidatus Hydrogenedentota bacterium]HOH43467.1 CinA family protein [Candidatus Hydrogenedentota bacterium]HPK23793.1 CinA family protein [Candidatus Hydrogenedentota bacterium]HPX86348.1 CinA family protein [Candidatus Hydrogenedentota bacterium]
MATEKTVAERCRALSLRLAVAESCSGGLIAHRLTNIPGISECFLGGVVSYANSAKTALLGVPAEMIAAKGAVSEEVARAMVTGVCSRLSADVGVAVTGIAGPGGGTVEKPVGTVWIAAACRGSVLAQKHFFTGDRDAIKAQTADAAFLLILKVLESL